MSYGAPAARVRSAPRSCGGSTARSSCSSCSIGFAVVGRRVTRTATRRSSVGSSKAFAESSSFGLALRSTGRAVPLVALGVAVLLGLGVNAVAGAFAERRVPVVGARASPARDRARAGERCRRVSNGSFYGENLQRDEDIPELLVGRDRRSRRRPARHARARDPGRRLRVVPMGQHRRPDHARAHGPALRRARAGALGIAGLGRPAQRARPSAAGGRARPVGDRAHRPAHERRRRRVPSRPRDRPLRPRARGAGLGCCSPIRRCRRASARRSGYGTSLGPPLHYSQIDEIALALPPGRARSAAGVSVFPVQDAPSIVRAEDARRAARGGGRRRRVSSTSRCSARSTTATSCSTPASYAGDTPALRREIAQPGSVLVVTDSNRKRGRRWGADPRRRGRRPNVPTRPRSPPTRATRASTCSPTPDLDAYTVVAVARTPR